jgi:dienelactone hydrolase
MRSVIFPLSLLLLLAHPALAGESFRAGNAPEPSCERSQLKLPLSRTSSDSVNLNIYTPLPARAEARPVVLMLPPIHGVTFLDRAAANTLCRGGLAAIIVDALGNQRNHILEEADAAPALVEHDKAARRSLNAVKLTLDYVRRAPGLDRKRVGLFGMSLGAILSLLNAEYYSDRIDALALVAGASDLPTTLALSKHKAVEKLRESRIRAWNLSGAEAYRKLLADNLEYLPSDRLEKVTMPVHLTISTRDIDVPAFLQEQLWEELGRPEVERISARHGWTLFSASTLHMSRVLEFFLRKL